MSKFFMAILLFSMVVYSAAAPRAHAQQAASALQLKAADEGFQRLGLKLRSDKSRYLPGEVVTLRLRVVNSSSVELPTYPRVDTGNLKVFISKNGSPYKNYAGPGWGIADAKNSRIVIGPGQSTEATATVLYHNCLDTCATVRDSELYQNSSLKDGVDTDYALPEPGTYLLKVALVDFKTGRRIESTPLKVVVEELTGDDRQTWTAIKNDGHYALFLQSLGGSRNVDYYVVRRLQELVALYPKSRYSGYIRSRLSAFSATAKGQKLMAEFR